MLLAAGMAALRSGPSVLAAAIGLGIASHAAIRTRARTALHLVAPVLFFALVLTALQWLNGAVDILLLPPESAVINRRFACG
jgi:hypothetical protein